MTKKAQVVPKECLSSSLSIGWVGRCKSLPIKYRDLALGYVRKKVGISRAKFMKLKKPAPPSHLTAAGQKLWSSIFAENEFDAAALLLLATLCEQFDRLREAQSILKKDGVVTVDRFGQCKAHPAVAIESNAIAGLTRCWRLLGFDQAPSGLIGRPAGS